MHLIDRILSVIASNAYILARGERVNYPRKIVVEGANALTLDFVRRSDATNIAEIGVFRGDTSLELARHLNSKGELHLFDFEDRVQDVAEKIRKAGFTNIKVFGSSYKFLDSYNWHLATLIKDNDGPIYDYIFLDGAHTFAIDGLATLMADMLLKVGGYIDFDDYDWTLETSPSLNPRAFPLTRKMYTDKQIKTKQVKMIIDIFIRRSGKYEEVVENKIFLKKQS